MLARYRHVDALGGTASEPRSSGAPRHLRRPDKPLAVEERGMPVAEVRWKEAQALLHDGLDAWRELRGRIDHVRRLPSPTAIGEHRRCALRHRAPHRCLPARWHHAFSVARNFT